MKAKVKVLYVDDEIINLMLFRKYLSQEFTVFTADNVDVGFTILKENTDIQIVFSDFHMPNLNGLEFISLATKKYPEKKYSLVSSIAINEEIKEALDLKLIQCFFNKPLTKRILTEIINELIN